ncbi:SnoaL-like domain-containing protein [Ekhidna sp.]|uniref:SnoaL-like domain-containing protein n=1 Tax=Ekhidna sp. TaxID=2608089 RepID=UPI003BA8D9D1
MTTQQVADQLVKLCREGKFEQVYQELFSNEIESKEPRPDGWETSKGMDGLAEKAKKWEEMVEIFEGGEISDPIVAGDHFACSMKSKVQFKGSPNKIDMDEVAVYKVKDGKVVLEQFFYTPMS